MYKVEMGLASIVEKMIPSTNGRTDTQTRWNQYPSFNFVEVGVW